MPAFANVLRMIDEWVADGTVPGAAAAVWHRGEIVATHHVGEAQPGIPVTDDTLFALASVSKPFTATALVRRVEAGDLTLDTPVAEILPEFAETDDPFADGVIPQLEAQRDAITVRQILSHTAGLPENPSAVRLRMHEQPSLGELLDRMVGTPLQDIPGDVLRYTNVGPTIAARVVERVTGEDFHTILAREVLTPRGLTGVVPRPGDAFATRIAHVMDASAPGTPTESYNSRYWRNVGIPWGGFFGTPADVVHFAASFLPDRGDAAQLDPALAAEMIIDQTGGVAGGVNSLRVHWEHGAWGLGWEVKGEKTGHWTGTLTSPRTFCHWGQAGTLVWADPDRDLGLAVFANRSVAKRLWPLRPARWSDLSDAVIRAAESAD